LALLPLLPGGWFEPFLLPVAFPAFPANGTRMCHSKHVALGIFPLLWLATRQTLGCLLPQFEAVQTSPRRFSGQTFLSLSLASCVTGVKGDKHHRSVDLASLTRLASFDMSFSPVPFSPTGGASFLFLAVAGGCP
jgi:hypothetical protein